jgi:hypothetical protein
MAGPEHAAEVLELLRQADLPNTIVFEFFALPPASRFCRTSTAVCATGAWSSVPRATSRRCATHRKASRATPPRTWKLFKEALRLRCIRIDMFFMIGLPAQTTASVRATVEYCGHLFELGDKRLSCFISPMGPFIDPGSRGFEEPERFGYRLFARTLEQHRQLLVQPTWERILNYETRWMTRRELVDATYDAAEHLNELKVQHGRLSPRRGRRVARSIAAARALRSRLDAAYRHGGDAGRRPPRSEGGNIALQRLHRVRQARAVLAAPAVQFQDRRNQAHPAALRRRALAVPAVRSTTLRLSHLRLLPLGSAALRQRMQPRPGVAVDAGHAARSQRLVRAGRLRRLLRERHRGRRMAAAALGGVIRLQFLPDLLRQLQPVGLVLRRCVELAAQVTPDLARTPGCGAPADRAGTPAARGSCRSWPGCRLDSNNARCACTPGTACSFRGRRCRSCRSPRTSGRRQSCRKADADDESQQSAGRYPQQEPALRPAPQPRRQAPLSRLR